jgi:SAM-dependent methyltransferase
MFNRRLEREMLSERNKQVIKKILDAVHYDYESALREGPWGHWARTVMYRECFKLLRELGPANLDVLEISAGTTWKALGFQSFTEANFPEFDVCSMTLPSRFDLIIADQVFEHLLWPYRAGRNVHSMLKPGGYFLVSTPFLIKVHESPVDCSRWTELGLKHLLAECGFPLEGIRTGSWGNRACVRANFRRWARKGFRSLANEPEFPVAVWALAKK